MLPWDEGLAYTLRDAKPWRGAIWLAAAALDLGLAALVTVNLTMPPVRSGLTVAGFARNYNDIIRQYEFSSLTLDPAGQWVTPVGVLDLDGPPLSFRYTTAVDGTLTGLSFLYHTPPDLFGSGAETQQTAALLAMLAAQPEAGLLNWLSLVGEASARMGAPFEDGTFTVAGLTVTNETAYSGYEVVGDAYLVPVEGEEQTFSQTFSITRTAE